MGAPITENTLRLGYAGAIGLLCEVSASLGGIDADENRDCIEEAVRDWCEITGWTCRRILDRIEVSPP
jgi:hypothetical protein